MKKRIYFFNGELGSGKTTLVNQLIKSNALGKFFIIENEIANLGIDNHCLNISPKQIKTITGECICCADPKEFLNILKDITLLDYENIVIESSGATSLNQLLVNILVDEEVSNLYDIGGCIFLIDALGIDRTNLFDLKVSDFVIVTKLDALKEKNQFEKLDKFIKNDYPDINFYIKKSQESEEWIQKLLENKSKTFNEWALRVSNKKYHESNFTKILKGDDLENFNTNKAYKSMKEKEIVRLKGFYRKDESLIHVEMTPEQMKENIEIKPIEETGIVIIGRNKLLLDEFIKIIN